MYLRSSYTCAERRSLRLITMKSRERARPSAPATMRITPMTWRSTCAGCQVTPNRRIAPITMRATLAPIVTAIATSSRTFHSDGEIRGPPRPVRVTRRTGQVAESNEALTMRYINCLSGGPRRTVAARNGENGHGASFLAKPGFVY